MRIAFIGDLQYATAKEEKLDEKMRAVGALRPDFAVMMGDFGGSHMHSVGGYRETKQYMDMIGCPWGAILGNHDVEYAPFDPDVFDFETVFVREFGREPYFTFLRDGVLYIAFGSDRRPAEDFRTHNAVFISDGRYDWVRRTLDAHPGVPTVMVTHAPAPGSGLRRVMPLHAAATDTYLDQTFKAERWLALQRDYPQIKMWFSAHLHMSHDYDAAVTHVGGVLHVSCGVMTVCARDDVHHTRILDADGSAATVYTFDHDTGELSVDLTLDLPGGAPRGRFKVPSGREMLLGDDLPAHVWRCGTLSRHYIATRGGLLWEYLDGICEFGGAIALETPVTRAAYAGGRLFFEGAHGVFSVDAESSGRYERIGGCTPRDDRREDALPLPEMEEVPFTTRDSKEGLYVIF